MIQRSRRQATTPQLDGEESNLNFSRTMPGAMQSAVSAVKLFDTRIDLPPSLSVPSALPFCLISQVPVTYQSHIVDSEAHAVTLRTANGPIRTGKVLKSGFLLSQPYNALSHFEATAYVLNSTPAVLSQGRRCMREGWSYLWFSMKQPLVLLQDGAAIPLDVTNDVPVSVQG